MAAESGQRDGVGRVAAVRGIMGAAERKGQRRAHVPVRRRGADGLFHIDGGGALPACRPAARGLHRDADGVLLFSGLYHTVCGADAAQERAGGE